MRIRSISIAILLVSCGPATHVTLSIKRPAEIHLEGIDNLAIAEIKGRGEGKLATLGDLLRIGAGGESKRAGKERLVAELRTALVASERFRLLSLHAQLDSTARQRTAAIYGEIVRYDYDEDLDWKDEKRTNKKTKVTRTVRKFTRTGTVDVGITLRVLDLTTSRILAERHFRDRNSTTNKSEDTKPNAIRSGPLFDRARAKIVRNFVRMISPYVEFVRVSFETDKEIPELAQGYALAKVNDWDGAIDIFRSVVATQPHSPKIHTAHYNLGLSYMYTDRFDEARSSFRNALLGKSSDKYERAMTELTKRISDKQRLIEQGEVPIEQ